VPAFDTTQCLAVQPVPIAPSRIDCQTTPLMLAGHTSSAAEHLGGSDYEYLGFRPGRLRSQEVLWVAEDIVTSARLCPTPWAHTAEPGQAIEEKAMSLKNRFAGNFCDRVVCPLWGGREVGRIK
jgi:hypothetical protein